MRNCCKVMAISSLFPQNWEAQQEKRGARGKAQKQEKELFSVKRGFLKKNLNDNSIESNFDIENLN